MKATTALLVLLNFSLLVLLGQLPKSGPVVRTRVEMVNVLCTVRDRHGSYLSNLKREDFDVYEDGVRQEIRFFNYETGPNAQPLTVVLAVDTSGSMKEKISFEQRVASDFLSEILRTNKDMAAVLQFDGEVNLVQDFTYDHELLRNAILGIEAGGATKLYDAIWLAIEDLLSREIGRRVLVILSDGADTQSVITDDEAIHLAQVQDVVIYGIGVKNAHSNFRKLKKFCKETGGLFFKARLTKLGEAFAKIDHEIKNQYSIAYVSSNRRSDGSFRRIRVRLNRSGLKTTHRKGYYAPAQLP